MKKEKEINPNDIDAEFVIASFKNKERRNNPSSEPRALVPEYEKKQEQKTGSEETAQAVATVQGEISREEPKRKRSKAPDYEELFIQEAGITARTGKSVYIRKDHHDKIMKIVQVISKNQISLFSYIDNVLNHHFETFQDEITELYNKNNESIF
jgi:TorA maturation chaperone TorD